MSRPPRPIPGRRAGLALLTALVLAGCATPSAPPRRADTLSGRLALQTEGEDPQSFSASFRLDGDARRGSLTLDGPLGARVLEARWTPAGAWLKTAEGEQRYADLDALALEALGEPLPLRALPDWLRGRPWPSAPLRRLESGRFEQLGWTVDLRRRHESRVEVERLRPHPARLKVRLDPA